MVVARPIGMFLDHNVWRHLFERGVGIDAELPASDFAIGITREAGSEIAAIPTDQIELRNFVAQSLNSHLSRPSAGQTSQVWHLRAAVESCSTFAYFSGKCSR